MCAISVVMDSASTIPMDRWTRPAFEQLKKTADAARKLDELTGQPDCVDPEKAKILERIEARLTAIEKRLAAQDSTRPEVIVVT